MGRGLFRLLLEATNLGSIKTQAHPGCVEYSDAEDIDPPCKELTVCYTGIIFVGPECGQYPDTCRSNKRWAQDRMVNLCYFPSQTELTY